MTASVATLFIAQSRSLFVEYRVKIGGALAPLSDDAVWQRTDDGSNAIGNLLLHLAGNVRQWIVAGVGERGEPARDRPAEFSARHGADRATLLAHLDAALRDVDEVLAGLTPDDLTKSRSIQSRETTVLAAIYHVVEHFGMHAGQIILLAKARAPGQIRFYEDEPTGQARPLYIVP